MTALFNNLRVDEVTHKQANHFTNKRFYFYVYDENNVCVYKCPFSRLSWQSKNWSPMIGLNRGCNHRYKPVILEYLFNREDVQEILYWP